MAEVFKNIGVHATTVLTDVYTVPENTTAMILFVQAANVDGVSSVDVSIQWYDSSLLDSFKLAHLISIPSKSAIGLLDTSKLILETGDKIQTQASADGDADISISILEIS